MLSNKSQRHTNALLPLTGVRSLRYLGVNLIKKKTIAVLHFDIILKDVCDSALIAEQLNHFFSNFVDTSSDIPVYMYCISQELPNFWQNAD